MKAKVSAGAKAVRIFLGPKEAPLAVVQGAAHLLADRAWAVIERRRGGLAVTLSPKDECGAAELAALGALFNQLVSNQALRQRLADGNREILEYIVSHALVPAAPQPDSEHPAAPLTPQQQTEIDRLILEADTEISELKKRGAEDPLGIRKTWEETNER